MLIYRVLILTIFFEKYQVSDEISKHWLNIRFNLRNFTTKSRDLTCILRLCRHSTTKMTNWEDFLARGSNLKDSILLLKNFKRKCIQVPPSKEELEDIADTTNYIKKYVKPMQSNLESNNTSKQREKAIKRKIEYPDISLDWDTFEDVTLQRFYKRKSRSVFQRSTN